VIGRDTERKSFILRNDSTVVRILVGLAKSKIRTD